MEKKKSKVGQICIMIILLLSICSNLYTILKLNIGVLNDIVELIEDMSAFFNIACIIFLVTALFSKNKKYVLAIGCAIDIILVNHLYSNTRLLEIKDDIKNLIHNIDMSILIFVLPILSISIYFIFLWIRDRKRSRNEKEISNGGNNKSKVESLEEQPEVMLELNDVEGENRSYRVSQTLDNGFSDVETNDKKSSTSLGVHFVSVICMFFIFWGILDYILFNKLPWNIPRPQVIQAITPQIYYSAIICAAIILCRGILYVLNAIFRNVLKDDGETSFRISAIISVILEIIFLAYYDRVNVGWLTNRFISAVTENAFSSIFALILTFIILQIACMIVLHIIFGNRNNASATDPLIGEIKKGMQDIERKIVRLGLNIIKGCLDLFDFIPDFFATIAAILLEDETSENEGGKHDGEDE